MPGMRCGPSSDGPVGSMLCVPYSTRSTGYPKQGTFLIYYTRVVSCLYHAIYYTCVVNSMCAPLCDTAVCSIALAVTPTESHPTRQHNKKKAFGRTWGALGMYPTEKCPYTWLSSGVSRNYYTRVVNRPAQAIYYTRVVNCMCAPFV